jgi:splicing factor 1
LGSCQSFTYSSIHLLTCSPAYLFPSISLSSIPQQNYRLSSNTAMRIHELTGTNSVPLASNRRINRQGSDSGATAVPEKSNRYVDQDENFPGIFKQEEEVQGRSPVRNDRKRKRGSRWGDAADSNSIAGLVGLPTMISTQMTNEQVEAYCIHLRILEITQKIKINDIVPSERLR